MAHVKRNYRLLIVDDDETDCQAYCRLLTRTGAGVCEITQASSAAEGLAVLRKQVFDCLLLDFSLPDMTGIEFLAQATRNGELPCAVVLITGQGNEAVAVEAMKRGVQDYLVKDKVNASSLWRAMTHAVLQTELRQRLARTLRDLTAANAALEQEAATRIAAEAELRAAKEAAEQASQAKTRFVAMVTHELRTPLNGVLGYAQLLRLEGGLSPHQDTRVGAMIQAGQHLLDMIERVLDFASIEAGRMTLHPVPVAIHELSERCIGFIGPMATEHALRLRLVAAHDAPRQLHADPARLRQVLLNLLGNAVKYTDSGSVELRLLAGAAPDRLRIEVADTGPGISDTASHRLFQDFERLDAAQSVEGTGLGLAIAARIVGLMGGEIGHCPNPGGGSVFWLELPVATDRPIMAPAPGLPATAAATAPATIGRHLLLVDDIAMNRDVIAAFLHAAGHQVEVAASGLEAVQRATAEPFDLILMDVHMAGMDGLEATRRIRALPAPQGRTPILALTAYAFARQIAECRDAGMDGHITKPVDYATLVRAIDQAIAPNGQPPTAAPAPDPDNPQPPPDPGSLPLLDRSVLQETLNFLQPTEVAENLESLRARKKQMMRLLERPVSPSQLTDAAHALASTAGMFGFAALSAAARRFETAMTQDEPEAEAFARCLHAETCASLAALDALLIEARTSAP